MDGTEPCGTAAVDRSLGSTAVVAVAAVATAFGVLPVYLLGALAIQIRADLAVSDVALGLSVSGYFAVSALMSVPAGRLVERVGAGPGMALGALASSTSLLVAGLAGRPSLLAAGIAVAGFANAIGQVSANLALAQLVPFGRQGLAYGIKQAAVPAATGIAGLAVPIVALTVGWRWAFIGGAILPIVFGVWTARCQALRSWPAQPTRIPRTRGRPDVAVRRLAFLAFSGALGTFAANAIAVFLVASTVARGIDPALAGILLFVGSLASVIVRAVMGSVVDAHAFSPLTIVAIMMTAGAVGLAALSTTQDPYLIAIATLVAYAGVWGWNGVFTFAIVRTNPSAPAAATGITQAGLYLGGIAGPAIVGHLASTSGYPVAWRATAATAALGAAGITLSRVRPPRHPDPSIIQEKR